MSRWPMREASRNKLRDPSLGNKVHKATLHTVQKRAELVATLPAFNDLRKRAREARLRALDRHNELLATFTQTLEARGIHVTIASTPADACSLITRLVMDAGGRVTKSKSMTSEEVGLNAALEAAGATVTETDLGELIVQLAKQAPSHVTAPAIHLSTEDIAKVFREHLGMKVPAWVDEPKRRDDATRKALAVELSLEARRVLRDRFLEADVGISGANLLVANSGTIVLVENEGNIQLTTCLPRRHIVLAGIDKLIENDDDLAVILQVLPVSATAQRQTCYVSLFADAHPDMHVVLLDHGRTKLMADPEQRDLLACIRCGACMNVCPVYRNISGHAYGGAYPGPIGSLLMPHYEGADVYGDLPFASSLCGACSETCPVGIPLHEHLLQLRARVVASGRMSELGWTLRAASFAMQSPSRMQLAGKLARLGGPFASLLPAGRSWLLSRELPPRPAQSFHAWWANRPANSTSNAALIPSRTAAEPLAEPAIAKTDAPPSTREQLQALFAKRLAELGPEGETELHCFDRADQAIAFLRDAIAALPPEAVIIRGEPSEKRGYELGITPATLLIADTGGVLMDLPDRSFGRASTLAETHLVVASAALLVPTFSDAIAARSRMLATQACGGYQVIVTGPSRTADVEKVLVIPAHGPRKLIVVLCDDPIDLLSLRPQQ